MCQLNEILENKIINNLIAGFERSPNQLNHPHESDAEIIQLGNIKLAITTDSISEEISTGLYDDPYLIGWMIVTVNISDLAAVGAIPIGILISEIIPDILVKGADWAVEKIVGKDVVEKNGGKVMNIEFVNDQSTSKIIDLIVKRFSN